MSKAMTARIGEEKEREKKSLFLLMNKGNFIFCLSFRTTRTTFCTVICYSFFVTICDRSYSGQGSGKLEKKKRRRKNGSEKKK
jgi:hypothetical protein